MKSPFNFRTGDTPARLIADTLGFVLFLIAAYLAAWGAGMKYWLSVIFSALWALREYS